MKSPLPAFFILICLLTSCAGFHLEKRHYRNGFYLGGTAHHTNEPVGLTTQDPTLEIADLPATISTDGSGIQNPDTVGQVTSALETAPAPSIQLGVFQETFRDTVPPRQNNNEAADKELDRQIKITQTLGIFAIVSVILGIIGLEATVYLLPLLLIGIFLAIFGLRMGRLALQGTKFTGKHNKNKPHPKRKQAKNAYWLNLAAIILLMLYVVVRVATFGGGIIAICITLALVALAFFLLFKMGVFTDLED